MVGAPPPAVLLLSPALSLQGADHADATVKSNGVGNGLAPPGLQEEEEGQGYIRAAGAPTYALQETSF